MLLLLLLLLWWRDRFRGHLSIIKYLHRRVQAGLARRSVRKARPAAGRGAVAAALAIAARALPDLRLRQRCRVRDWDSRGQDGGERRP